jgi:hypothetical protein
MFAVITFSGATLFGSGDGGSPAAEIERELRAAERRVERLEAERNEARARRGDVAAIEARLDAARRERDGMASARNLAPRELKTGWGRLDQGVKKAAENPTLFFYKVQNNAYKFSWALIPISVPFLWLLFLHRRRYREAYSAYDHMVFVTYSIAFMSLGMVVLLLLGRIGLTGGLIGLAAVIIPPVHIFRQLRGAYRLGWPSALWRTIALLALCGLAMQVFLLLLLALGVLA